MSVSPARLAALSTLRAVASGSTDLASALERARRRLADERDRDLATELSVGTCRWRARLDAVVVGVASRPLDRIDPEVLDILRLGAYQILFLSRVPASAVVNDAVQLTQLEGHRSASGFVNAVLRRLAADPQRVTLPARPPETAVPRQNGAGSDEIASRLDYLSVTLSHPRWLVDRWLARFGFEQAAAWAAFNNEHPPVTLRANRLKTNRDALAARLLASGVHTRATTFAPDGLVVEAGNPMRTPLAGQGEFVIQDEGAQLVAAVVAARPGERILDACAAPGGKTTLLAAAMEDKGLIVASDTRERRLRLLRQTVRLAGTSSVRLVRLDLLRPAPFCASFDAVLLDAPCSGLGTIRRDPDVKWRRQEADLVWLAARQREMLANAAGAVRPGGRLVYATCSSEPEENEAVVMAFLKEHPAYYPASAEALRRVVLPAMRALIEPEGWFRTSPARDRLEAYFAAVLCRQR